MANDQYGAVAFITEKWVTADIDFSKLVLQDSAHLQSDFAGIGAYGMAVYDRAAAQLAIEADNMACIIIGMLRHKRCPWRNPGDRRWVVDEYSAWAPEPYASAKPLHRLVRADC